MLLPVFRHLLHWSPLFAIFAKEFSFKDAFKRSVLDYLYKQDRLEKFTPQINQSDLEKYVHIHIEEAELSLDPEAQRALISNLIDEAFHKNNEDRKLGLMIATHSPYIVNHLNVLLRAGYLKRQGKTIHSWKRIILPYIVYMKAL